MISRRDFIAKGAMGTLVMASGRFNVAKAESPDRLGVQLYGSAGNDGEGISDGTLAKRSHDRNQECGVRGFYWTHCVAVLRKSGEHRTDGERCALYAGEHDGR